MSNKVYQSQKRTLAYSKSQIDKAGKSIRHGCSGDERKDAILKIQNYREMHLYPLMLIKNHLFQATKRVTKSGVVARRLKMLTTIIDKLERPSLDGKSSNAIQLTRMQDIGGCRAIVPDIKKLIELHKRLKSSRSIHKIIRTNDYLKPKESGYSGIHVVYSCFLGSEEDNEWKKTKIEVQLRTELQHAWATSLEIIDTLEGIKLKTSTEGHPKWRRFFRVAGLLVAHEEKACLVSEDDFPMLTQELRDLEEELEVRRKLAQYSLAIRFATDKKKLPKKVLSHQGMYLVKIMRPTVDKDGDLTIDLYVGTFGPKDMDAGLSELAESEADESVMVSVLVAAGDVRTLRKAYPNYFGSTTRFQSFLEKYIEPKS